MFFGGGFPFGFQQGHHDDNDEENEQEEQEFSYYELLDCRPDADIKEIRQKYQVLAEKYGPEGKEPSEEMVEIELSKYEKIKEAFEVLSDPAKRDEYDAGSLGGPHQDMLDMMFGGQKNKKGNQSQKPKMQPTKQYFEVTLEKMYCGGTMSLHHQRARLCQTCSGKGGQNVKKCSICKGQGAVISLAQVGPGMYTQVQKECESCKGMGQHFEEGGKCATCQGKKIAKKSVDLQVPIPIGIPAGQIIKLQGEGNQVPQVSAGDLILVVQQVHHQSFSRKGADLYFKKSISLIEALLGFNFKFKHLDGKEYTVFARSGQIVADHSKKVLLGLGMPFFKNQKERGNLIIEFKVVMPKRGDLTPKQLEALTQVLPGKINARPSDHHYQMLEDYDKQLVNSSQQGGKKKDDEEEGEGQQGIGCQAQ